MGETNRIIARMTLTPHDRVYLAHSETVTVDITEHPELVRLREEVDRLRRHLSTPAGVRPHRGARTYRFAENPAEKVLSDEWHSENTREGVGHGMLSWLMGDGNKPGATTARDEYVAATVIQWLGTPVGHSFLEKCGFVRLPGGSS